MAWFREYVTKRLKRSSKWPKVRKYHIERYPYCAACHSEKRLEVHHKIPFAVDPSKELDHDNLLTMCSRCHLLLGHGGWFGTYIPEVQKIVKAISFEVSMRKKI